MSVGFDYAKCLRDGMRDAQWHTDDLWVASVAVGGVLGQTEIDLIASGARIPTASEYNVLAAALNDQFSARGQDHPVRYWGDSSER
jgi:hypothetical protein